MQKKQDHILWTLESKRIDHEQIDIGDPNREKDRAFMRENVETDDKAQTALPPQIFNDETYIGVRTTSETSRRPRIEREPPFLKESNRTKAFFYKLNKNVPNCTEPW